MTGKEIQKITDEITQHLKYYYTAQHECYHIIDIEIEIKNALRKWRTQ